MMGVFIATNARFCSRATSGDGAITVAAKPVIGAFRLAEISDGGGAMTGVDKPASRFWSEVTSDGGGAITPAFSVAVDRVSFSIT